MLCNNTATIGKNIYINQFIRYLNYEIYPYIFSLHVFPAGSHLAEYFCKISGLTSTFNCFLPHSIVTGKPFDDQKSLWKKMEGLTWQYLWNYCLLQAKRRNLPQKSKLLVSGVKLSRASNRIIVVITFKNKPVCNDFPVF